MTKTKEIDIWKTSIPNSLNAVNYQEIHQEVKGEISKVSHPTLTVFIPEKPNGTSVIICPGGGYAYLSIKSEGYNVAEWFNSIGVTAFVLKYRLPSDEIMQNKSIGPLQDAQESMRIIRRNVEKWNLNPDKIGIIGFSAGGHLAASLSTKYDNIVYQNTDKTTARPNFSILIYPVISMEDAITHKGSKKRLLGRTPSSKLIKQFSIEKFISADISPTFLAHAIDDKSVPIENSIHYLLRLREHDVISEMHLYQNGGHGFGLGKKGTSQFWTEQCEDWLGQNKLIQ